MIKKISAYIITVACISLLLFSCMSNKVESGKELSAKDKMKIGDQLFEAKSYYNALDYYLEVLPVFPKDIYLQYRIAESYYYSRDYENAAVWYKKVWENAKADYPLTGYQYADCLKRNEKYDAAIAAFEEFKKEYSGKDSRTYRKLVKYQTEGCEMAKKMIKKPVDININHLNSTINAAYTDYAPMPVGDSLLLFASLYSDSVIYLDEKQQEKNTKYLSRLFKVQKNGSSYSKKGLLPATVNDVDYHTGNGTFSLDGKRFYFTKCKQDDENDVICSIWMSEYENGNWKESVKLNEEINMPDYTSTQPTIGPYKRDGYEMLYFVSDRPDGQGGKDIWYALHNLRRGSFSAPKNTGRKLNSEGDEVTPYFDPVSNMLYFSSDGHPGIGGYDVFKSEGMMRRWSDAENLGYPLNSSVDDMYYVTTSKGNRGYLVSNRRGSIALKSPTCCDDIYEFEWINVLNLAVVGYVYDEDDSTRKPIDSASVSLYATDKETGEPFEVGSSITKDTAMYFFRLNPDKDYRLSAAKEGYFSGKKLFKDFESVSTKNTDKSDTFRVDLFLKKMEMNVGYELQNIYYDFDKATLRPESKRTLDSLDLLLNEHPQIKIELGSHTDSKGTDTYNEELSQKRAESVVKYLIKKGIKPERLVAKGYGEKEPVAPNINPDGSDNPEGRQMNRRTEFKIIGKLENVDYVEPGEGEY